MTWPSQPARLGLPGVLVTGADETWSRVRLNCEVSRVVCPKCDSAEYLSDPEPRDLIEIADTPFRGRPCELAMQRHRYRCQACNYGFVPTPRSIHLKRRMTLRLIRYIEDSSPRRTRTAIAEEVGVAPARVGALVMDLARRLAEHHRMPTPRVLGIDDLKMNRQTYTVLTDAVTGHAVGLIESGKSEVIIPAAAEMLRTGEIEIVVSDLGKANLALVKALPTTVLHVADRWHILKGCREAAARVFRQQLDNYHQQAATLTKRGVADERNAPLRFASTLKAQRLDLIGRRRRKLTINERTLLDEQALRPILSQDVRLKNAFYARINLAKVYGAETMADARAKLDRFYQLAADPTIAAEFETITNRIRTYEGLVLNYIRARQRYSDVPPAALTTSSTERRNGFIRWAWKSARGTRNFEYLRLLTIYQPWRLDVDIVECSADGCDAIEGPVHLVLGLVGQDRSAPLSRPGDLLCIRHRSALYANSPAPNSP